MCAVFVILHKSRHYRILILDINAGSCNKLIKKTKLNRLIYLLQENCNCDLDLKYLRQNILILEIQLPYGRLLSSSCEGLQQPSAKQTDG